MKNQLPISIHLFTLGFRPFFCIAGLAAVLLMLTWMQVYQNGGIATGYYGLVGWHSHEMLFGYTAAVIAGFLLTAVGNWTGTTTLVGNQLAGLCVLWVYGRLLPCFADVMPHAWIALVDLAFLPCLAYAIAKPILSSGNHKNLMVVALLTLMTLANGLIHMQLLGITVETANFGNRLMLVATVLLILLISGRVFPFFTERALSGYRAQQWPLVNDASVFATAFLFFIDALFPATSIVSLIAGVCVILHAIRFWGWYTHRIWYVPLLWVLYSGYLWMIVGFILMTTGSHPMISSLATHAFTVGGIGVLTLGMMARVSLGHTGRLLQCSNTIVIAFVLLNLAVALRVLGPLWLPIEYTHLITWAAGLWVVAFTLFLLVYLPILLTPRADDKTG